MLRAGILTVLLFCVAGCGGVGQPAPYDATGIDGLEIPTPSPDPGDFVDEVDNRWLPLRPGTSWRYAVEEGGRRVGTVQVSATDAVAVAGVDAIAVRTTTRLDREGRTEVTRYYSQDRDGNVWLVGEDRVDVTWRAGEGYAAGLAMPAEPRVGDAWVRVEAGPVTETVRVVEDPVGDEPDAVTLEQVETGTRTTYVAGSGPVLTSDPARERTIRLVD